MKIRKMQTKRVHPKSIGSHRVADGNMARSPFIKAPSGKNPERRGQALLFLQLSFFGRRFGRLGGNSDRVAVVEHN